MDDQLNPIGGPPVVFGCDKRCASLPIENLPVDTIGYRLRLREKCLGAAYVRTGKGCTKYLLGYMPDYANPTALRLIVALSANYRSSSPADKGMTG